MHIKKIGRLIGNYFLRGLLLVVPISVIAVAVYRMFIWLDTIITLEIPGLGLLMLLTIITFTGWVGSTVLFQPLADVGHEILQRIPLLKTIYDALKDMLAALVGSKKSFDRPVLVKLSTSSDLRKLGFITQNDLRFLGIEGAHVSVYMPHSFAWSGNLFIVPAENLTPLDARASDVMKFIVSGGVATAESEG